MKVIAKKSFSGIISMHLGQEREIENEIILKDLIEAGYIEPVSTEVQETKNEDKSQNAKRRTSNTKKKE